MTKRVAVVVALVAPCLGTVVSSALLQDPRQSPGTSVLLAPGTTIERTLDTASEDRYALDLQPGEHAAVSATQRGLDVVITVVAPDGTTLGEFNDEMRAGREEPADVVAVAGGTHTLIVRGVYPRAVGDYSIRVVSTRAATDDDRARQALRMARVEYARVADIEARPLIERALALAGRSRSGEALEVARVRVDLASVLLRGRQYAGAVSHFEQALLTFENMLGAEHPATADVWTNLAATYAGLGQRQKAEALARRALEVTEKALGSEHPQTALCLITLGNLREDVRDFERAEEFMRRALAIVDKTHGANRQMGVVLNNLGSQLIARQRFEQAEELLERSLRIQEDYGDERVNLAITLQNLGVTARQRRDYVTAERYYLRALELRRRSLAPDHPDLAYNLNNLATLYRSMGDLPRSLETNLQALSILEKNTGRYNTVIMLGNIARTYAAMGDFMHAIEFQRRVEEAIETELVLQLATGSEREKLAFVSGLTERIERTVSLDASARFGEPQATELAALVVLQRKGRILDAMTDMFAAIRRRLSNAESQQALDKLSVATGELASMALRDRQKLPASEHLAALQQLERRRDLLESELGKLSAEYRAQTAPVTLDAVRAALPENAALIEFVVYRPFDPRAETNATSYGAPRYVAYVVTRRDTRGVDLGPASSIDAALASFRQALGDPQRADVSRLARQLDAAVMQPVRDLAGSYPHLLISPDGALNLIPFEALQDEQGRYAIERYQISYLTSGRDLLRLQTPRQGRSDAVVVADPVFGGGRSTTEGAARQGSLTSVDDLAGAYFMPLRGTALEAERIKALFPEATILARERATAHAVGQLQAPRILHIATHGFFIRDPKRQIPNPLLRSGLALAGANLRSDREADSRSDGILTALEAAHLDLWGTKLVTLSACDTGIGEIRNGEGVYGLRRAFFLAGAETVVMSLWPVNDSVTRELMTDYYAGLKHGFGRGDALRRAQRAMLARRGRQHPFYWASFIQAGEWGSLDGRRSTPSR